MGAVHTQPFRCGFGAQNRLYPKLKSCMQPCSGKKGFTLTDGLLGCHVDSPHEFRVPVVLL